MAEITFSNPQFLWFFLSIPILFALHYISLKYIKRRALEFANFTALERVTKRPVLSKNYLLLLIRIGTLAFLILSVAGTTFWYFGQSSDFDFVLAIDASSSMLAGDFEPSRLSAAKETALEFVNSISSKVKIGVVSFAGTSYVEQRLTDDLSEVREVLGEINIKPIGGTDLGEAIITASNLLLAAEKKDDLFVSEEEANIIILITDGRSNVGVPIQEAIDYANTNHITVHTIGMGTEEGGIFAEANVVLSLDEEELKNIASLTNGNYYKAIDGSSLKKAYSEIATSTRKKLSINLTIPLMLLALLSLFVDWGLINTKYSIIP